MMLNHIKTKNPIKNSPGHNTGVGSLSPSLGDLPNPRIEPGSPALQVDSLPAKLPGKPDIVLYYSSVLI